MPITYTPATPNWVGSLGADLVEIPESGQYTLGYGYKWTQKFEGLWATIISNGNAGQYNRGVFGGPGNNWVIAESRITRARGQKGRIEIDWQSIDSYVNPDEWSGTGEDLQPRIERNPLFQSLTPSDIQKIQQAILAINNGGVNTAINQLPGTSNPALAAQLYNKLRIGYETYYLSGSRYTWTTYYLPGTMPVPSLGGFTQTPGGPAGYILPAGISWLRLADEWGLATWSPLGGITKLTRHWLGGPDGFWDADVYPPG